MKKIVTRIISVFIIAAVIMSAGCVSTAVPSEQEHEFMEIGEQEPATQSQQETVEKEPDHGRPRSIREEQTIVIIGPDQPVEEEVEVKYSVAVDWLMNHIHMSFTVGAPEQAPEDKSVVVAWLMNNVHMSFTEGAPEVAPEDKSPAVAWLMNHVYSDTPSEEYKYKDTIVGMPGLAPEPRNGKFETSDPGITNVENGFHGSEPFDEDFDEDHDEDHVEDEPSVSDPSGDDRPEPTSKNVNTGGGW